jgi:hypothetical protein
MEYSKDLLQTAQKPKWAGFMGVLSLLLALAWMPVQWIEKNSLSGFDGVFTLVFLINGVSLIMAGKGYSLERIFGKAYLKLNDQALILKPGIFDKERHIPWEELGKLDYKPNRYEFGLKNGERVKLSLVKLNYDDIQELKRVIKTLAEQKNIQLIGE